MTRFIKNIDRVFVSTTLAVAIAIAIVLAIVGSTVFIYPEIQNWKSTRQEEAEAEKKAAEIREKRQNRSEKLEMRNEIDPSTWQTYRNEKYGFELKYPKVFEQHVLKLVSRSVPANQKLDFSPQLQIGDLNPSDPTHYDYYSISAAFLDFPAKILSEESIDEWIARRLTADSLHILISECEKRKVASYDGAVCIGGVGDEGSVTRLRNYYFITALGGFEVSAEFLEESVIPGHEEEPWIKQSESEIQSLIALVDQILSTFKVLK